MLRFLLSFLLASCLVSAATACGVSYGARVGSSIPNLHDNGGNDFSKGYSTRVAPFFGIFGELEITPAFSLDMDVNYAAQGGKRDGLQPILTSELGPGIFYARFKNTAKLNYVEIPVLARYRFTHLRNLYLNAGPYMGFLASAKNVTKGVSTIYTDSAGLQEVMIPDPTDPNNYVPLGPQDMSATVNSKSDLHAFNWGIQAGGGITRPFGRGVVSLDLRGGMGLTNIQKDTAANGKNITGNLVIALGYGMGVAGTRR